MNIDIQDKLNKVFEFLKEAWERIDLRALLRGILDILVQVFEIFIDIIQWFFDKI